VSEGSLVTSKSESARKQERNANRTDSEKPPIQCQRARLYKQRVFQILWAQWISLETGVHAKNLRITTE
jgi:hypothetical protein